MNAQILSPSAPLLSGEVHCTSCSERPQFTEGMKKIESTITKQLAIMKSEGLHAHEELHLQESAKKILRDFSNRLPSNVTLAAKTVEASGSPCDLLIDFLASAAADIRSFFQDTVIVTISHAFSHLYDNLLYLLRYRKDIHKEMLTNILTELKYQNIVSPPEHTQIIEDFDKGYTDILAHHATSIAERLNLRSEDMVKLLGLIESKGIVEGFRFLHLLTILKTLLAHDDWEVLLTRKEKDRFRETHTVFHHGGSIEPLHSLVYMLYSRMAIYEWIKKIDSLSTTQEQICSVHTLKKALLENNPLSFAKEGIAFFEKILKEHAQEPATLLKSQVEELHAFFCSACENSEESLFTTLALEIEQKQYFNQWNKRAKSLHTLLKIENRQIFNENIIYDIERVDKMMVQSVELWELYGKIFEDDSRGHISNTYYSAQYGKCVATWRKVNKQLIKLATHVQATPRPHAQCNCHYAKSLSIAACSKWQGLPERISRLSSLNHIPELYKEKKEAALLGLFCTFGSGHRTALDAVINYSQQNIDENEYSYHVRALNVPLDVLLPIDALHNSFGKIFDFMNGDWFYNFLLQKDRCDIIEWLKNRAGAATPNYKDQIKKLLRDHILKENPDLIVTTYSFHNPYIEEVAEELGRPLLHIATDFDLSGRAAAPTHPVFKMAIPAAHPKMMETLGVGTTIKEDQVAVTGPIVRPPFQRKSNEELIQLRREMGIGEQEHVLVISSGGCGVPTTLPELLARTWNDPEMPLRIIVIPGKNASYADHLLNTVVPAIAHPEHLQINVYKEFIEDPTDMANLYHVADLIDGKPGGLTSNEVAATGTQFLGDQSQYRFSWEYFNNDILIDVGLGDKITPEDSEAQIIEKIKTLLKKGKIFPSHFHGDTTPAQNYASLMSGLINSAKQHPQLQRQKRQWNPEEIDLATYIAGQNLESIRV